MNKYVVAYIPMFSNLLLQTVVEATSDRDAMIKYLAQFEDICFTEEELLEMQDADSIAEACYDMDCNISVIRI